ncbi:MAG: ammonium transporter [Phototrophicaceae bacterium]|jgi:Amt family ammonium transporter
MLKAPSKRFIRRTLVLAIATVVLAVFGTNWAFAQDGATVESLSADIAGMKASIDTTWVLLTGFLVFFMQCGFAMLETGLITHKSAVNALLENFIDAGLTGLCWWAVGFGVAFGTSAGGFMGTDLFFLSGAVTFGPDGVAYAPTPFSALNINMLTFFFFQFAFAATASTITTGAMAERTDFVGDLIYSAIIAIIIYPVIVHWVWGGGWLATNWGFHDFAGSNVVHTVGGVIALVGAIILGPRTIRKGPNGEWVPLPRPHNMALATIGTMILWFGWYGFNPGSTLGAIGYEGLMGLTVLNTTLGASAAVMVTTIFVYFRSGKWDLAASLNGSLAGLVGVTAGCGFIAPWAAVVIGLVAGILVIVAADFIESLKIDDPVGAFAVHGACGIFGTIAVGLFAQPQLLFNGPFAAGGAYAGQGGLFITGDWNLLIAQLIGSGSTILWSVVTAVIMFGALNAIKRLRVNAKADEVGIDVYEHGASAWPDVLPVSEEK